MAHQVLNNVKVWVDGYDFSGDINALGYDYGCDEVEDTNFGDTTHTFLGGLFKFDGRLEGAVDLGTETVEGIHFGNVGLADTPVSISPDTGADGETGYMVKAATVNYSPGATIGELLRFDVNIKASNERLVRGTIMHNATRTATANGTARQLGAVAADQKLYAVLHVLATVSGTLPTLDVVVASSATDSWPGTTRITFSEKTALGSEFATPVAGAITDTWWRVQYTIGGSDTPTFPFVVIIGII